MKSLLCGTPGSPQKPGTVRVLSQHTGRGSWEAGRHADVFQMFPSFPHTIPSRDVSNFLTTKHRER